MDVDQDIAQKIVAKGEDLSHYNLEGYDDDDPSNDTGEIERPLDCPAANTYFSSEVGPFSNIKGLTYYRNNEEDPYITLKEVHLLPFFVLCTPHRPHRTKTATSVKNFKFCPPTTFS